MTASAHAADRDGASRLPLARADRPPSDACILFLLVLALMAIGVLMVYSASRTAHATGESPYFLKELAFVPIGLVAFIVGALVPYRWLNRWWVAVPALAVSVGLLVLVLVIGGGRAKRWLYLPLGLRFQPSELAKFVMVIFLAWFYSRDATRAVAFGRGVVEWFRRRLPMEPHRFWRSFLPAILVIGLVCGLIVTEDFGTGALIGMVAVVLCLIAGWRWWYPAVIVLPGLVGFYFAVWCVPYRLERLVVWLDPWKYYEGAGWHICQSLMALGRGGLFGVGLGAGIQKLYTPENETDFIFAVLCEEMGVLGGLLVIGLFGLLIWRGGKVIRQAPDRFGFLLAAGIVLTIGLQAILNIGVVTSALPAKGISLPFISYGGSGLVMMSLAAGLLASVARRCEAPGRRPAPLVSLGRGGGASSDA
jgi:cell division protein FtsW